MVSASRSRADHLMGLGRLQVRDLRRQTAQGTGTAWGSGLQEEHLVRMLTTSSKTGLAATGYGLAAATATSSAATPVNRRGPDQTAVRGRLIP